MKPVNNLLDAINKVNKMAMSVKYPPITYDGLVCPECGTPTVHSGGNVWCPNEQCGWGFPIEIKLMTRWSVE